MIGQIIPQQNLQTPHELTPRDDVKKMASEVLKRVDQLIRKGDLDCAQREIVRVKELDPRNVYALAMEERISTLKKDIERMQQINLVSEQVQPSPSLPIMNSPKNIPPVTPVKSPLLEAAATSLTPKEPISASSALDAALTNAINEYEPLQDRVVDRSIELESYRKTLSDMWSDGALTIEEKRTLNELRTLLEITDAEHEGIEKNVKRECYKNVLLRQLLNNPVTLSDIKSLSDLRNTYLISEEEHMQIQVQMMSAIQHKQKNKILVIDDDTRLLELLAASLEDNGFDVIALPTSDEAYALLRKFTPDLILCDINLETSTMGGFTFYEKIQELNNIPNIPFIFLSGLSDDVLVRTGKELGVDDYLMKPISEQTLVSTLRGKLKRFKQLKKTITTPAPAMVTA